MIISFSYGVIDGKKAKSRITLLVFDDGSLDKNYTVAELNEFARASLPVIRNVLVGGVPTCSISFHADFSDLLVSFPSLGIPEEYADVEEIGKTQWVPVDGYDKPTIINFPTFDEALVTPGTKVIDDSDLRFAALITLLTDGLALGGGRSIEYAAQPEYAPIAFYTDGKEYFKRRDYKSRKKP